MDDFHLYKINEKQEIKVDIKKVDMEIQILIINLLNDKGLLPDKVHSKAIEQIMKGDVIENGK